jgi:hypothetical protein
MGIRSAIFTVMLGCALAACSSGDSATPAASAGSFSFAGATWTSVTANLTPTVIPQTTGLSGSSSNLGSVSLVLYDTPTLATSAANYPLDLSAAASSAGFSFGANSSNQCYADSGTVNVTSYGAVGSTIDGTMQVDGWDVSSAPICTSLSELIPPVSGSFSIVRSADDVFTLHSGVDTMTVNRSTPTTDFSGSDTYTENTTTVYDPRVNFSYDANYSHVRVDADLNIGGSALQRHIDVQIYQIAEGTFNLIDTNYYVKETFDTTTCTADTGSITVTTLGTNGILIDGSFNVSTASPAGGCPGGWSGTFHVVND